MFYFYYSAFYYFLILYSVDPYLCLHEPRPLCVRVKLKELMYTRFKNAL